MILKDIVSLLANRINQPRVIEGYLRKVYAKGYEAGTKQSPWISIDDSFRTERNGMQVRTQRNFNKKTGEDLFGLSIKLEVGHRYCKYPIGHQDYKTITEATKAKKKVMEQLRNGAHLDYGINGTAGINKAEYVKIVD